MKKHSNIYYIYKKDSGFEPVEKAKKYKTDMDLDLFIYNGVIYEGQTGIVFCSVDKDYKSIIEKNGGMIKFNKIIESHISTTGKSPRYTRRISLKKIYSLK